VYFTLAVSAATAEACAALADTAVRTDPRVMPIPGPARVAWRAPDVLGALCPELLGLPLAGTPWHGEPRTPATVLTAPPGPGAADWRRDYGEAVAGFLRGYVLDHDAASPVFGIVRRRAAEHALRVPHADAHAVWALATLAALLSGDWLNAREPAGPALVSRGRTSSRPARSRAPQGPG
jgi:hypothetical protein